MKSSGVLVDMASNLPKDINGIITIVQGQQIILVNKNLPECAKELVLKEGLITLDNNALEGNYNPVEQASVIRVEAMQNFLSNDDFRDIFRNKQGEYAKGISDYLMISKEKAESIILTDGLMSL